VKVYDASALLAVVFSEAGAEAVLGHLIDPGGCVSAVNWAEVASKMVERGVDPAQVPHELRHFGLEVMPLDEEQALAAGALRASTRSLGLSLGDRCCLALAQALRAQVITAERLWTRLAGFDIALVR
jgi:ribonuclease VapC